MTFLDDNLFLTEKDVAFLKGFQKGNYRPDLIFGGETLNRIKNHPMAIWKTQNNRESIQSRDRDER